MSKKPRAKSSEVNNVQEVKKDKSPKVYQRDKIKNDLTIAERDDWTKKQEELINLIEDKSTKVVFIQGPAGTSKTFTAIYAGLKLMNKRTVSDIVYVRSIAESASKSLGSLPGEANEKMMPFLMPLHDKLDELLSKQDIAMLVKEERIQGIPINYLRGASLNAKYVVIDEAQNLDFKELTTAITRIGKYSKFIILGDPLQSDIQKSGFMKMFDLFNSEESKSEGIHSFSFTRNDIVRRGILKYIVEKIESTHNIAPKPTNEPMFPSPQQ